MLPETVPLEFQLDQRRVEVLQYTHAVVIALENNLPNALHSIFSILPGVEISKIEIERFIQIELSSALARLRDVDYWLFTGGPMVSGTEWQDLQMILVNDINAFLAFFRAPPADSRLLDLKLPESVVQTINTNLEERAKSGRAYLELVPLVNK